MNLQQVADLLTRAQSGDEEAKNELVRAMIDNGCMKRLSRYLYMNKMLEPDEVKGEFWFGVAHAIAQTKPTVGNPLVFLSQKGIWRVVAVLRERLSDGVVLACVGCGKTRSLTRRASGLPCPSCAGTQYETYKKSLWIEDVPEPMVEGAWDIVNDFRKTLSGRDLDVFDLIVNEYDRDNSINYIMEIAKKLGVSGALVAKHIKRLRVKFKIYLDK